MMANRIDWLKVAYGIIVIVGLGFTCWTLNSIRESSDIQSKLIMYSMWTQYKAAHGEATEMPTVKDFQ